MERAQACPALHPTVVVGRGGQVPDLLREVALKDILGAQARLALTATGTQKEGMEPSSGAPQRVFIELLLQRGPGPKNSLKQKEQEFI